MWLISLRPSARNFRAGRGTRPSRCATPTTTRATVSLPMPGTSMSTVGPMWTPLFISARRAGRPPRSPRKAWWSPQLSSTSGAGCGGERRAGDQAAYRNMDNQGIMHFPGFSREAAEFLVKERTAGGVGVDTLSLDYGPSTNFGAHFAVLPANRWGIENLANLGRIPPKGATLFVGVPRVQGASGGPSRILAVW